MFKKTMLIGAGLTGKSSLIRALSGQDYQARRALAVEYYGPFINTPGEFLENRRFYRALITAASDCTVLALVQDATHPNSLFPPLFARMFNREVIGLVTKIDSEAGRTDRARRFLESAGVGEHFLVSTTTGQGLAELRTRLLDPETR